MASCWRFTKRTIGQARIHTGFHPFTEIGRIFHNKNAFQVEIWKMLDSPWLISTTIWKMTLVKQSADLQGFIWGEWNWPISRTPGKGSLGPVLKSTEIPGRVTISAVLFTPTILDAFYGFKKVWFFHCSPPHSFQSEKPRLTWDGKCEKFSVLIQLFSLTQAHRGYSGFQVTGMIELNGGKNQNPKKSLDENLSPKKSHAEFPSHNKNFQKA